MTLCCMCTNETDNTFTHTIHFQGSSSWFACTATFWQKVLYIYNLEIRKKIHFLSALPTVTAKILCVSHCCLRLCLGKMLFVVIPESQTFRQNIWSIADPWESKMREHFIELMFYMMPSKNQWAFPSHNLADTPVRPITLLCPCL